MRPCRRLQALLLLAGVLLAGVWPTGAAAQNFPPSVYGTPLAAVTAPATSSVVTNIGQVQHAIKIEFPTASPTSTPGALTAALVTNTGNLTNGVHNYCVTFVTDFAESNCGPLTGITTDGTHQRVSLTNIPLGPAGTSGRNVYRQDLADSDTDFYGLGCGDIPALIADNTTTVFADNEAYGGGCFWSLDPSSYTLTPIQVRLEASYTNLAGSYFPICPDVTDVEPLTGSPPYYAFAVAYGAFPYVRVRSLVSTPSSLAMTVRYFGHAIPIVPFALLEADRYVF